MNVFARILGPSGLALVGNLRSFVASAETLVTLGMQNGVIKYTAQKKESAEALGRFLFSIFVAVFTLSILAGLVVFFGADSISRYLFDTASHRNVIRIMGIGLPLYAAAGLFTAVINGLGKYRYVTFANIIVSVAGLILSLFFIWNFRLEGALISVVLMPVLVVIVSFYYLIKSTNLSTLKLGFSQSDITKLGAYSLMTMVAAFFGPFVMIAIRNNLIDVHGMESAGYWEGMNRLSAYYMMFLGAMLTSFYLPKLSVAKTPAQTRLVYFNYYKGVMPVFTLGLLVILVCREWIIEILFTEQFLPMSELFVWQLGGDFFKGVSLILAYNFFAKRQTKSFIISELASLSMFYLLTIQFSEGGAPGVAQAYFFSTLFYAIGLMIYNRPVFR